MEGSALPRDGRIPAFDIGELVCHRRLGVRGVVVDVQPPLPPLEADTDVAPRYEVLLHNTARILVVGEDVLEPDLTCLPIVSPLVRVFFHAFRQGRYVLTGAVN